MKIIFGLILGFLGIVMLKQVDTFLSDVIALTILQFGIEFWHEGLKTWR
jgi:hypothetical protein